MSFDQALVKGVPLSVLQKLFPRLSMSPEDCMLDHSFPKKAGRKGHGTVLVILSNTGTWRSFQSSIAQDDGIMLTHASHVLVREHRHQHLPLLPVLTAMGRS